MAPEGEQWRETAWNLYCAFSTYQEAQDAMEAARRATYRGFYPFARYIAARHNFTEANVSIQAAIGNAGVKVFVCALAYEIEHGQPPPDSSPQTLEDDAVPYYFDALAPITYEVRRLAGGVYAPGIAITPGAFRDDATMMTYLQTEIPKLSERMRTQQQEQTEVFDTATRDADAVGKWQDDMAALLRRLNDEAVPEWPMSDVDRIPYLETRGFSRDDAALITDYAKYISDPSGLSGYVFPHAPAMDPGKANLLRSQNLSKRARPKSQLAVQAAWWTEVCGPPGRATDRFIRTMAAVALEAAVEASIVRHQVPNLERAHCVTPKRPASRAKKRDT